MRGDDKDLLLLVAQVGRQILFEFKPSTASTAQKPQQI